MSKTERKSIAVIGGAGFLSRELITALLNRDYSVFIGDVNRDVARGELPYHLKDKTREKKNGLLKMGYVDVTNPETFRNIPEDCDTLIQTAGYFKFWPVDREKAWRINYHGTRNLVEHALNNGIRDYLYYSSIEAVGSAKNKARLPGAVEKDPPAENELKKNFYKISKARAHQLVQNYFRRFAEKGKRLIIRAPSTPIGIGMEKVPTGDLIKRKGGLIRLVAPNSVLSCIDTRDLARDDIRVIERGRNGETYVSVGFHSGIHDILKEKFRVSGIKPPRFILPNWSLIPMAIGMELLGKVLVSYRPHMTVEQAVRTQKNHFYDTSFTRERLGLKKEDYFGLEESIEHVIKYMKDRAVI